MVGDLIEVEGRQMLDAVESCFLGRHPDSAIVAPGRDVHASSWYTLNATSIYYFGGFGNVSYIGFIPVEMYRSIRLKHFGLVLQA